MSTTDLKHKIEADQIHLEAMWNRVPTEKQADLTAEILAALKEEIQKEIDAEIFERCRQTEQGILPPKPEPRVYDGPGVLGVPRSQAVQGGGLQHRALHRHQSRRIGVRYHGARFW